MNGTLSRRDLLLAFTATAFTSLQLPAAEPNAPLFFTKDEFALLDTLTELVVPKDEHSAGAHDAGVAVFIDRSVAESFLPEDKTSWRKGLAAIDELSHSLNRTSFVRAGKRQQIGLLTKIAAAENHPETDAEKFFTQLKQTTAFVYYSSKTGIHDEMNYKGNVILQEFVGYDAT